MILNELKKGLEKKEPKGHLAGSVRRTFDS